MPFFSERRMRTGTIRFFDLFSGIGGFREGLRRAGGFECVGHCEMDPYAEQNYRKLFATEGEWYCDNATDIQTAAMPDFDLLCAGFPCQAFSIAGKRGGFSDARGTLFFEAARLVADKRPAYFLLENVPGLLSHDKGRTFHTILSTFSDLGYHVEWKVLNSKDFGVPQSRKRVYLIGYLDGRCAGKILPVQAPNGADLIQIFGGSQGERVYDPAGVSCTLTAQAGGMGGKTGLYQVGVPIKENTKKGYKMAYPGDSIELGYATLNTRRGRVGHALQWAGWIWRGTAVWDKGNSRPQKGRFRQQAEYIVWGSNGPMPINRPVSCLPGVFRYSNPQNRIHVTEKPLQLMKDVIQICEPGGLILDPFAGAGTTILAAAEEGYEAVGIEVTDAYYKLGTDRVRFALESKGIADGTQEE